MRMHFRKVAAAAVAAMACFGIAACGGGTDDGREQIFLNLSYSGNNWQDEAANLAMAVATSPQYADKYSVQKQISGTDVQKQISDIQSMIASGAKLIVSYPLSPTALDPVVTQGCAQGVTFVFYDSTVNAPCAYNVAFITGPRVDDKTKPFFGAQTAEALVNLLDGRGRIFMNRGVAGTATDTVHYDTAKAVFDRYPGIEIVSEYHGDWNSSVSQQQTARALAAHPDVDGVWSQDGEAGVVKALQAAGKRIPVTGESSNFFVQQLGEGWPGVASGSPPAQAAVAMKVGLEILENGAEGMPNNIEMPMPWTTTETAKECPGTTFEDGCNYFSNVDDSFVTIVFNQDLLPESTIDAARTGAPFETVQPLPDMNEFAQPESRRVYTRGACDEGWTQGPVDAGQTPAGLNGCVQQ